MSSVVQQNFEEFLRSHVVHMRSVILDQFSSVQLLRLAVTNKSMRQMSITELGRRTLKINMYEEDTERVDNIYNPTTIIRLRENGSCHLEVIPKADMEWFYTKFGRNQRVNIDHESHPWITNSCQMLTSLLQYSRVAELDMGPTIFGRIWAFYNGLSPNKRGLYMGRLTTNEDDWYMPVLDFLLPKHVMINEDVNIHENGYEQFIGQYMSRGLLQARELDIAVLGSGSKYLEALPVLLAPIINLREKSRLGNRKIDDVVRQWQDGNRKIVAFSACVQLHRRYDLNYFCHDIMSQIGDCTETDYPGDHEIPKRILDQMTKTEEVYGSSDKDPRAISVIHDDGQKLMILLKPLMNLEVAAIGMFEVAAV